MPFSRLGVSAKPVSGARSKAKLQVALPQPPTRREATNRWTPAFHPKRYPGGDPASFDVDTHH